MLNKINLCRHSFVRMPVSALFIVFVRFCSVCRCVEMCVLSGRYPALSFVLLCIVAASLLDLAQAFCCYYAVKAKCFSGMVVSLTKERERLHSILLSNLFIRK